MFIGFKKTINISCFFTSHAHEKGKCAILFTFFFFFLLCKLKNSLLCTAKLNY